MTINGATALSMPYQCFAKTFSRPCQPIPDLYESLNEQGIQPICLIL